MRWTMDSHHEVRVRSQAVARRIVVYKVAPEEFSRRVLRAFRC